jgi:hypothetical protein
VLKDWIVAFLKGYRIEEFIDVPAECEHQGSIIYDYAAAGLENYAHKKFYEGSLNISDALGELSPTSRECWTTVDELYTDFFGYWKHFTDFKDFFSKISLNVMTNIKPIKKDFSIVLTEILTTKNYTNLFFYTGEMTNYIFVLEEEDYVPSPVTYTEGDPLGPNPINNVLLWTIFEGLFEFGVNSQLASRANILKCQENTLNMILLDIQAYNLLRKGDGKDAWFALTDSFTFAHNIVDGCYHTGKEIVKTIENIKEKGQVKKNLLHNLYFVVSGLFGTWSQVYYHDWINLLGVLGGLTYRVFVYGAN